MINKLSKQIHENNKSKGFYDTEKNIGEMLCLIHSEVSEALECDRKDRYAIPMGNPKSVDTIVNCFDEDESFQLEFQTWIKDTFEDELADIMIRVMDLAAHKNVDLESHIIAKMRYNSLRPHKHGKKY